jgi:uncharacterized phage infection (PIP) family protein YhgE
VNPLVAAADPFASVAGWQWWQYLGAGLGVLGLSPAPWIYAVLTRRLMPLGAHLERVAELKEFHKREIQTVKEQAAATEATLRDEIERIAGEREYERAARATERDRGDAATSKLSDFAQELGKSTNGLLAGVRAARAERTGPIDLPPPSRG